MSETKDIYQSLADGECPEVWICEQCDDLAVKRVAFSGPVVCDSHGDMVVGQPGQVVPRMVNKLLTAQERISVMNRDLEELAGLRKGIVKIQRRENDRKTLRRFDAESYQKCRHARKQDRKFLEELKDCPSWAALFGEWRAAHPEAIRPPPPRSR